jgi:hypothetical protein
MSEEQAGKPDQGASLLFNAASPFEASRFMPVERH